MSTRRDPIVHEPHLRNAAAQPKSRRTDTAIAELVAAASLLAFAALLWPPAVLLVTATLAGAYAWIRR